MTKFSNLIFLFLFLSTTSLAQKQDAKILLSDYTKGKFITSVSIEINAPYEKVDGTLDKFISQYNNHLDELFIWAIKDLKLQGEKDDFIMFNIKSHTYDENTNRVGGNMDINVTFMKRNFPATRYETSLSKFSSENKTEIVYEMHYCENVIDKANAKIVITPTTVNSTLLTFDVNLGLSSPYHLMTKKQYRTNIEWRFAKLLSNIRDESEK
ncbi:hypothetical protein LJC73_03820 [Bacteroidales bacterium OttesenSCG-928-L14]|nr:hypothetical protein [Bacteroidales bacterium OttesenSCG-928-L14]